MATYRINKGINKPVEFKGLKAQYLLYFFVGLLGIFMAFTSLYLIGLPPYSCVLFAGVATGLLRYFVFKWNRVYGQHGLMKNRAAGKRPDYLVNRGKFVKLLQYKRKG